MKTPTYDFLDALPETLYQAVVTHSHGSLELRCKAVILWRQALLAGRLPHAINWPEPDARNTFKDRLLTENLLQLTVNNPAYCDQVLVDLLNYLSGEQDELKLREIEHTQSREQPVLPDERLEQQMDSMFRDFNVVNLPGFDLEQGGWQRRDLRRLLKLYKRIKYSPYLRDIMLLIGRGRKTVRTDTSENNTFYREQSNTKQYPQMQSVLQARGIYLSDDISRMLPAELMALGHPVLKSLWHARRAEGRLMCYQYDGVMPTHRPDFDLHPAANDHRGHGSVHLQGPIILCLDTSASMKGMPELRAKAVALEAMRVAMRARRQCLLFMFSGVEEVREYELNHTPAGWRNMLHIINHSFNGGTDVGSVLLCALSRLQQAKWRDADICLVSDGRFMADTVMEHVRRISEGHNSRVHGLHVSRWNATQMERLCQWVYHMENLWGPT